VADHQSTLAPHVDHRLRENTASRLAPDWRPKKRFADAFLRQQRISTALVVPLPVDDKPFGTIGLFCRTPREFTLDDVRFGETIAHLLARRSGAPRAEEQCDWQGLTDAVLDSVARSFHCLICRANVQG